MKNNNESKRTPGKWKMADFSYEDGDFSTFEIFSDDCPAWIAHVQGVKLTLNAKANAEYICKCVNSHDDLVAALQEAQTFIQFLSIESDGSVPHKVDYDDYKLLEEQIDSALTKGITSRQNS